MASIYSGDGEPSEVVIFIDATQYDTVNNDPVSDDVNRTNTNILGVGLTDISNSSETVVTMSTDSNTRATDQVKQEKLDIIADKTNIYSGKSDNTNALIIPTAQTTYKDKCDTLTDKMDADIKKDDKIILKNVKESVSTDVSNKLMLSSANGRSKNSNNTAIKKIVSKDLDKTSTPSKPLIKLDKGLTESNKTLIKKKANGENNSQKTQRICNKHTDIPADVNIAPSHAPRIRSAKSEIDSVDSGILEGNNLSDSDPIQMDINYTKFYNNNTDPETNKAKVEDSNDNKALASKSQNHLAENKVSEWKIRKCNSEVPFQMQSSELIEMNDKSVDVDIGPDDSASVNEVKVDIKRPKKQNSITSQQTAGAHNGPILYTTSKRASRGPETKEAVFQQALSLMSERCVSRPGSKGSTLTMSRDAMTIGMHTREWTQTPLISSKVYPFGIQQPEYFLVDQQKPTPMAPIPAWKGYNGNVYFQPISIQQTQPLIPSPPKSPDIERCSPELQQIYMRSRSHVTRSMKSPSLYSMGSSSVHQRVMSGDSLRSRRSINSKYRNPNRGPNMMSQSSSNIGCRQLLLLDKDNVFTSSNENIQEEVVVLASQESTGSLHVLEPGSYNTTRPAKIGNRQQSVSPQGRHKQPYRELKEKIHKGSMARHMSGKNRNSRPLLSVNGDKFSQPPCPSPLLRAQTQYSQSNQRGVLVSPELSYHSFTQSYEKLPPLEHLRASLRQIDHSPSKESLVQFISPEERMKLESTSDYKKKPFIKFSPEFRKGHNRSKGHQQRVN